MAIGGDDTLGVAYRLHKDFQMPMVGVPKTIDNDLMVTDFTFGFDTAINIVTEAIDRLRTTAESHRRIIVVETMGRHAGWIACFSGIATAADYILIPEVPIDIAHVVDVLKRRRAAGKNYNIVVVSEGAEFPDKGSTTIAAETDAFGHVRLGGVGSVVAKLIEDQTGYETRCVVLGHLQRGGCPPAPTTACSPPVSASEPAGSCSSASSARWSRSPAPRSSRRHSPKASPPPKPSTWTSITRRRPSSNDPEAISGEKRSRLLTSGEFTVI